MIKFYDFLQQHLFDDVQTIWIISDTHFDDPDMMEFFGYPSGDKLVARLNRFIGKNDCLIHLGDVGNTDRAQLLKGKRKILICGNHDKGVSRYPMFDYVFKEPLIVGEKLILSHEPIDLPYFFNIHGHEHGGTHMNTHHLNCCLDVTDFKPLNLNKFLKSDALSSIKSLHRATIDQAILQKEEK